MTKKWPEVRDGHKLQITEVKNMTTAPQVRDCQKSSLLAKIVKTGKC